MAGFGDILHDHIGVWLGGYSGNLGDRSVLYAELHSIKHGLLMAWTKGYRRVWCESDSLHHLQLLTTTQQMCFHNYANVIEDIKALVNRDWEVRLSHIWREGNCCADALAKLGGVGSSTWFF